MLAYPPEEAAVSKSWAYGVTTVPERFATTLPRTLASLAQAGFPAPRLFVDGLSPAGAVEAERCFKLEVVPRQPALRVFGNWLLSMLELYLREPTADRFAIFQDDIVCSLNIRQYLDSCRYPDGHSDSIPRGYWNLITYPDNESLIPQCNNRPVTGWYISNQRGRGAQGLVFSRAAIVELLASPYMIARPQDQKRGWRNVDGGIVTAMRVAGWKEYVHNPSLVFHIGEDSTFPTNMYPPHGRQPDATTFRGEDFDLLDLLPSPSK